MSNIKHLEPSPLAVVFDEELSNAQDGDVFILAPGHYETFNEVTITKDITLKSESPERKDVEINGTFIISGCHVKFSNMFFKETKERPIHFSVVHQGTLDFEKVDLLNTLLSSTGTIDSEDSYVLIDDSTIATGNNIGIHAILSGLRITGSAVDRLEASDYSKVSITTLSCERIRIALNSKLVVIGKLTMSCRDSEKLGLILTKNSKAYIKNLTTKTDNRSTMNIFDAADSDLYIDNINNKTDDDTVIYYDNSTLTRLHFDDINIDYQLIQED